MRTRTLFVSAGTTLVALLLAIAGCGPAGSGGGNGDEDGSGSDSGAEVRNVESSEDRITSPSVSASRVQTLTEDNAQFAFDLYDEIAGEKSGENFFYSPHSISSALAMTYAGAEGRSETQMQKALHFDLSEKKLHPAFNKLDLQLESRAKQSGSSQSGSPFELEVANSLWGQQAYPFEKPFLDTLARHYGTGLKAVNFRDRPEPARKAVNSWVEKRTENKIEKLFPRGSINRSTRFVLANAIYFKASWAHKFDKNRTQKQSFQTASGTSVQVDMMALNEKNGLSYAEGSNWKAVELPYVGETVSMVVVVPDAGAFGTVEQRLTANWIRGLFQQLSGAAVRLRMPKFGIETKFSVKEMLRNLGMTDPFEAGAADLTGIAPDRRLFIQDVLHKSFVRVDEKGTEAAAATGVTGGVTSAPEWVDLEVDRPFLFLIRDRETNAIVFAGRVLDPS